MRYPPALAEILPLNLYARQSQPSQPLNTDTAGGLCSCVWRRLGHTSLDSNERSGHGARELKTVRIDAAAGLLRLQLQRCHINALNPGNQVRAGCKRIIERSTAGTTHFALCAQPSVIATHFLATRSTSVEEAGSCTSCIDRSLGR